MLRVRAGEGAPGGNHVSAGRPALLFISSGKANVFGFCFFSLVAAAKSYPPTEKFERGAALSGALQKARVFGFCFFSHRVPLAAAQARKGKERKKRKEKEEEEKRKRTMRRGGPSLRAPLGWPGPPARPAALSGG